MTAPNIKDPDIIEGRTARHAVTGTLESALENAAGSNRVLKINSIFVANVDGNASADISISLYDGVNDVYIAKTVNVPAKSTQIISTKDTYFYIEEDKAIRAIASVAGDLELVISYEEIGDALAGAVADAYINNVVLLLHGDGTNGSTTITDSSSNAFTVTANGDAQISTTESKFGGSSLYFDGVGDYLTVPTSSDLSFDGDFTIEFWMKTSSFDFDSFARRVISFGPNIAGALELIFYTGAASSNISVWSNNSLLITGNIAAATGNWVHIALARSGTTMKLFVDGVQSGSDSTTSTNFNAADTYGLTIGRYQAGNGHFNGYLDDLRITKGVARYTTGFTPPTAAFPDPTPTDPNFTNVSLLLHADGADGVTTLQDDSLYSHSIIANDNVKLSTAQSKFGGASVLFDGTGDYLTVPEHSDEFTFGTGDWTLEFWVYRNVADSDVYFDWRNTGGSQGARITLYSYLGTLRYYANGADHISATDLSINTWHHVAVCKASGSTRMFFNGTQVGSTFSDNLSYLGAQGTEGIWIGSSATAGFDVNGYMDDIRITKGVARYTADFTPPTDAFPQGANVLLTNNLLVQLDAKEYPGSGATWSDLTSNGYDATLTNTTYDSANDGSIVLNGSTSNISLGSQLNNTIAQTNTTISMWVKFDALGSDRKLLGIGGVSASSPIVMWYDTSASVVDNTGANDVGGGTTNVLTVLIHDGASGKRFTTSNNIFSVDTWYNVTVVLDVTNGSFQTYINGGEYAKFATSSLGIGSSGSSTALDTSSDVDGNVSHITVYDRALSLPEVVQNYNAIKDRYSS